MERTEKVSTYVHTRARARCAVPTNQKLAAGPGGEKLLRMVRPADAWPASRGCVVEWAGPHHSLTPRKTTCGHNLTSAGGGGDAHTLPTKS